jgi:hypothetical protein
MVMPLAVRRRVAGPPIVRWNRFQCFSENIAFQRILGDAFLIRRRQSP